MTSWENSCWALEKLAPVLLYLEWTLEAKGRPLGQRRFYESASVNCQHCTDLLLMFLTMKWSLKYKTVHSWEAFSLGAYHFKKNDCQDSIYCEETCHYHHNHSNRQVWAEHADGGDPPAVNNRQTNMTVSANCYKLGSTDSLRNQEKQMKFTN